MPVGATVVPVDLHGDGCPIADVSTAAGDRQVALLLIPIPPRPARTGIA